MALTSIFKLVLKTAKGNKDVDENYDILTTPLCSRKAPLADIQPKQVSKLTCECGVACKNRCQYFHTGDCALPFYLFALQAYCLVNITLPQSKVAKWRSGAHENVKEGQSCIYFQPYIRNSKELCFPETWLSAEAQDHSIKALGFFNHSFIKGWAVFVRLLRFKISIFPQNPQLSPP